MNKVEKLVGNNTAIAWYYFAEMGKKLSEKTARVNFQILSGANAIDKRILKLAQISYLKDLQKEINLYLKNSAEEIKKFVKMNKNDLKEDELPQWLKDDLDKQVEEIENGTAIGYSWEEVEVELAESRKKIKNEKLKLVNA